MQRSGHGFQTIFTSGIITAVLAVLTLPVISSVFAVDSADETPSHYMYFKDRINFDLDKTRLSVRYTTKSAKSVGGAALADAGLDVAEVEATAVQNHDLIDLSAPLADASAVKQAISSVTSAAGVEFASPVFTTRYGWMTVTPDIIVGFAPESRSDIQRVLSELAGVAVTVTEENFGGLAGVVKLHCNSQDGYEVLALANRIAEDPRVEWAEPDFLQTCVKDLTPNDPSYSLSWGLNNTGQSGGTVDMDMDADLAWDVTTGSEDVYVLVIDDGTQLTHPDLNILAGADFTGTGTGGNPGNACDNHGTAVAGCVTAIINNTYGSCGVAPTCKVMAAKYSVSNVPCDGSGTFSTTSFVNALTWGENQGARVSNCSSGFNPSSTITSKYNSTYANGMVHFSSSGNDATGTIGYPAELSSVNAVGAINRTGNRASFSTYGTGLAFVAPGQTIYTTDRTGSDGYAAGDFDYVDGTSFSSPFSAGVAALILSVDPGLTATEVEERMQAGCTDRGTEGYDIYYGWGIVNAYEGVSSGALYGQATPTFGTAPLEVGFQGTTARPAISWEWSFGDGEYAYEQDPTHTYTDPGYYDVDLTVYTATDSYTKNYPGLISIQADTIALSDVEFDGDSAKVDIWLRNYIPVTDVNLPFVYSGELAISYSSIRAAGLGVTYFSSVTTTSTVPAWHVATVHMSTGTGLPLPPQEGPVATLIFMKSGGGSGTNIIRDTTYLGRVLELVSPAATYTPVAVDGSVKTGCCVGVVGDANGDGQEDATLGDVSALIDYLFINGTAIECLAEADANQSGGTDPTYDDLTLGDISVLIDHLFINEPPLLPCL